MFIEALKVPDLAAGGMKAAKIEDKEVLICNYDGKFYALDRRCSHMKALLDLGTLEGYILTCPLHFAQFDITTGEALNRPVADASSFEPISVPEMITNINTYPVLVEGQTVSVDVSKTGR